MNLRSRLIGSKRIKARKGKERQQKCTVCHENYRELRRITKRSKNGTIQLSCKHFYCFSCIIQFAKTVYEEGTFHSMHCCGKKIPDNIIKSCLSCTVFSPISWKQYQSARNAMNVSQRMDVSDLDEKFFQLSATENWRRCPNCRMMVEKIGGCANIYCLCGAPFCYRCGESLSHIHNCSS